MHSVVDDDNFQKDQNSQTPLKLTETKWASRNGDFLDFHKFNFNSSEIMASLPKLQTTDKIPDTISNIPHFDRSNKPTNFTVTGSKRNGHAEDFLVNNKENGKVSKYDGNSTASRLTNLGGAQIIL